MSIARSYSDARSNLKAVIDAARDGVVTPIRREADLVAVVDAHRLAVVLDHAITTRPEVVAEADGWSIFVPGAPIAADGNTLEEAIDDFLIALREYADDWNDHLRTAHNHAPHWALAQFVSLSDDGTLRAWATGQPGL